ncbi:MAG: hypothetical protein ACLP5E_04690 [Streptosporangiaceae bacterium]
MAFGSSHRIQAAASPEHLSETADISKLAVPAGLHAAGPSPASWTSAQRYRDTFRYGAGR